MAKTQTLVLKNLTKAEADDREQKHKAMGGTVKREGPDQNDRYKLTITYSV